MSVDDDAAAFFYQLIKIERLEAEVAAWQSFVQTLQFCLEPKYQETVDQAVKHWKKQAEKVLVELLAALKAARGTE